jgi:hypothetical protein
MVTHDMETTMTITLMAVTAMLTRTLRQLTGTTHGSRLDTDRGAVSIEQVLWYAAAAISVAVVAAIIWGQIRTTASTPVQAPSAP